MELSEQKAAARKAAFARRKAAHQAQHGAGEIVAAALKEVLQDEPSTVLAGYMPIRTEIDILPAMRWAHAAGWRVSVPEIMGQGKPLKFREWHPEAEMVEGPFGAQVPASGAWLEPQLLLCPLVAFDARGYRLGYGGGFYDRSIEELSAIHPVRAIGIAYSAQEAPEPLPIEPTDQPLEAVITEHGIRHFR